MEGKKKNYLKKKNTNLNRQYETIKYQKSSSKMLTIEIVTGM